MNCLGRDKNAAAAKTHTFIPHVEKTAVATVKKSLFLRRERLAGDKSRTMRWDSTETDYQCNLKSAISDDSDKVCISEALLFVLLSSGSTTMSKCAVKIMLCGGF